MSKHNLKTAKFGGICLRCTHDLETRSDGKVWCSNPSCWHHLREPHATTQALNIPEGVET